MQDLDHDQDHIMYSVVILLVRELSVWGQQNKDGPVPRVCA